MAARARNGRGAAARWLSAALAATCLLAAMGLVIWRQGRALQALAALDGTRRDKGLLLAQRGELDRRIQVLESRARVLPEARRVLGMRTPEATEIVILPGETL